MKKILSLLFSFRSGKISDRYLLRGTPMEERLNISPAPWILTIVRVWVTSSVLLALSASNAHSAKNITQGSTALRDFTAPADFEYANERENEERKKQILERVPFFYRVSPQETILIQSDLVQLPECVRIRSAALAAKRHYDVIKGSLVSRLTAGISRALLAELDMAFRQKSTYNNFQNKWQRLLREGLLPVKQREVGKVSTQIRTIDSYGRINAPVRIGDMPDPPRAAQELAEVIFPSHSAVLPEFRQLLIALLRDGNLLLAPEYRSEAREQALKNYRPVPRQIRCGEVLIQSGQVVTPELMELAEAAERSIPPAPPREVYFRALLSLLLIGVTIFFLYHTYPELVRENRNIMLTGSIVCISLVANYIALKFFNSVIAGRLSNPVTQLSLQLFLPVSLCAIMLTVLVSYRAAMCACFLTVSVTVLLLSPAQPFILAVRFLTLAAITGLMVRKVTNYRTFFVRSFAGTVMVILVLNCDLIFQTHRSLRELAEVAVVTGINAFASAILALVMIFLFELVFNISTDMSLMVLCDYNHPLLERMKREAPGTLFHSMTVATLAEDAAKAIGANPLRAKAAALFHDIGKLEKARYFIENNSRSDELHRKLSPAQSAQIILGHVIEGLRLARTHRLSRLVRDAIRSHHGDTLVYFFYAKAKAETPDAVIDENLFRYGGRPPRLKELTILSLADACEAAVRSLEHQDPDTIRSKVGEIFQGRFRERQMCHSILTLKELDKVRESFIATLISIHHGRIAYTAESINEAAAQQMEQPQTSLPKTPGA